jgi:acetyltransferase-like isoleucine patch superfamily enzyme
VVYVKAKSKELGWRNLTQKVILANGKSYYETRDESYYTIGYNSKNAYCRPSCYNCQFKGFPRMADITLGDFWGIEKIGTFKEKDLGTSLVLLNSQKGMNYFENIKTEIKFVNVAFKDILGGNRHLTESLISNLSPEERKHLFLDLDSMTFSQIAKKYFTIRRTYKSKIKNLLKILLIIIKDSRLHPTSLFQALKYNHFLKSLFRFMDGTAFIPSKYCIIEISRKAQVVIDGMFRLGLKRVRKSKLETRLLMEDGAVLKVGNIVNISYGADIEVFKDAALSFGGNNTININFTVICSERIDIGKHVHIGRNVTIRDNNGGHYINRQNYKDSRPVVIEDNVWLGESCVIMPGVHIGEGAIIGACSFVGTNVPAYALVMGNPARVIDKNVLHKE